MYCMHRWYIFKGQTRNNELKPRSMEICASFTYCRDFLRCGTSYDTDKSVGYCMGGGGTKIVVTVDKEATCCKFYWSAKVVLIYLSVYPKLLGDR
jgi:hypothetical protein